VQAKVPRGIDGEAVAAHLTASDNSRCTRSRRRARVDAVSGQGVAMARRMSRPSRSADGANGAKAVMIPVNIQIGLLNSVSMSAPERRHALTDVARHHSKFFDPETLHGWPAVTTITQGA